MMTKQFDVHPPLGKMLVGFGGLLAGYNGSFEFESGHKYPPEINYTAMRLFLAAFGALMVPVAFMTMIELGFSRRTASFAAVLVLCGISAFLNSFSFS
jgi:dolichyl-phosphate-mannose-protein mannosyltransferase